jgi:hypothetical protein
MSQRDGKQRNRGFLTPLAVNAIAIQCSEFVGYNRGDADHWEVIGGGSWNGMDKLGRSPGENIDRSRSL